MEIEPQSTWVAPFTAPFTTLYLTNQSENIAGQVILRADNQEQVTYNINAGVTVTQEISQNMAIKNTGPTLINAVVN